jgi:transcription initiation factor TFIID TATA-box-binding protein
MKRKFSRKTEIKIANVVATVTLTTPLDLALIHERLPQTEIPGKSPWLKLRLKPDNTYTAFYKSGKFLITTKHPEKLDSIAQRVVTLLHDVDIETEIVKMEIHNVVINTSLPMKSSLESIVVNLDPKKASFEPEQFPALVYKDWGVSFLLFSTGSCIITGLKKVDDAEMVIQKFKEVIGGG